MPSQKQTTKKKQDEEVAEEVEPQSVDTEELDADVEDILGEIDDVLEENAEAFVKGFIQQGGE